MKPSHWLHSLVALALFCGFASRCIAAETIHYTLANPARVSAAIYDASGRQIRTVLSSEQQSAGPHTAEWDGLDRDGKPAPLGTYTWKLISGPGVKAEYLLSLGTSVGIHHWVGQHGGPSGVAMDGDGIMVCGAPEGSPAVAKVTADGTFRWGSGSIEPNATLDLAADGGKLFTLVQSGHIYALDSATGKMVSTKSVLPTVVVKTLRDIHSETADDMAVDIDLPNGRYLLRITNGTKDLPTQGFVVGVDRHTFDVASRNPKQIGQTVGPEQYRWPAPVSVTDGKLKVSFHPKSPAGFSLASLELLSVADRIDARAGSLAALFTGAKTVGWIDPNTGEITNRVEFANPVTDLALANGDIALVCTGQQVLRAGRQVTDIKEIVSGLESAHRLAVDPSTGEIFLSEAGKSQQIKRFSADGKLLAAYGRKGGRRTGLYEPQDFNSVADISADGHGGFVIVEAESAPRRTSHFDRNGKLLAEWFGGQQFYTAAVPQPENPNLVWMDSQWGWLMQVEVDYQKRTWRPRACYPWAAELDPWWVGTGKMTTHMVPFQADLEGKGKAKTYLWSDAHAGLILEVDEEAGVLHPIAILGNNQGGAKKGTVPAEWAAALDAIKSGLSGTDQRRSYTGFAWADSDASYRIKASELRLLNRDGGPSGAGSCKWLDPARLAIYAPGNGRGFPAFSVRLPIGRTKTGAPIWDWADGITPGPPFPAGLTGSRDVRPGPDGDVYQVFTGGGDGYASGLDSFHSHGPGWPSTLTDRTAFAKFDGKGQVRWIVANHAAREDDLRGTSHLPIRIAGFAQGCVGICDYAGQPCHFWTDDGLYVGELLDSRADDGLPARCYAWWRADKGRGDDFESNLALFQYDLLVGGSLATLPGGEVVFMGAGWNNAPVYRVHGLDQLSRQQGTIELAAPVQFARGTGSGLTARTIQSPDEKKDKADLIKLVPDSELEGKAGEVPKLSLTPAAPKTASPDGVTIHKQVWFEAVKQHRWPGGAPANMQWTGAIEAKFSEPYTLSIYCTGGARLWLDGKLVIDQWNATQPGKYFSKPIAMRAGSRYAIRMEWKHANSPPEAHLCWQSPTQGIEHVPAEFLYPEGSK